MPRGGNKRKPYPCPFCGGETIVQTAGRREAGQGRRRMCLDCSDEFYTIQRTGAPELFDCVAPVCGVRTSEYKAMRRTYVTLRQLAEGMPHVLGELEKARRRAGVLSID